MERNETFDILAGQVGRDVKLTDALGATMRGVLLYVSAPGWDGRVGASIEGPQVEVMFGASVAGSAGRRSGPVADAVSASDWRMTLSTDGGEFEDVEGLQGSSNHGRTWFSVAVPPQIVDKPL